MASFGSAFIVINKDWASFKAIIASKTLAPQYDDTGATFQIFAVDSPIVYVTTIYQGEVPAGFDQAQNDIDKADFLANYQPVCNAPVLPTGVVAGTSVPLPITTGIATGDVILAATTATAVRRTAYTEQSANAQRSIRSSSPNDTNTGGTGARTVKITYLDVNGNGPYTEIVNLNGTTPVDLSALNVCFIEQMEVETVGASGSAEGTLTLYAAAAGAGAVIGTIAANSNRTFWCHHYVPANKACFITGICAGGSSTTSANGALFFLRYMPLTANSAERLLSDLYRAQGNNTVRPFTTPIRVTGPARVIGYARPDTSNSITYRLAMEYYERVP